MLTKHPLYYHTFGAPMATRNKQVSSVLVAKTVSQSSFSSGVDGWVPSGSATLINVYGNVRAVTTAINSGMKKVFSTEPGKTYRIKFKINLRGWPYMYVKDVATTNTIFSVTDFLSPNNYAYTITATGYQTQVEFLEVDKAVSELQLASFTLEEVEAENGYRFGFNGKENDDETQTQDYGFRIYNSRLGRFLSVDPLTKDYAFLTPYQFGSNTPIVAIDLDGLEAFFIHGTNSSPARWMDEKDPTKVSHEVEIIKGLTNNKTVNTGFSWENNSGVNNNILNRISAAISLVNYVIKNRVKGEEITLIGHSHGGNVAILAARLIKIVTGQKVNLITIATPVYNGKDNAQNPDNTNNSINDHIHLYNTIDKIQTTGASNRGDKIETDRTFKSNLTKNIEIDVSKKYSSYEFVDAHSFDLEHPELIESKKIEKLKPVKNEKKK